VKRKMGVLYERSYRIAAPAASTCSAHIPCGSSQR